MLYGFIEINHEKISASSKLQVKIDKHYGVTKILFNYYKVEPELTSSFIQYSRYVLSNGTEDERIAFANGINTGLLINDCQTITSFYFIRTLYAERVTIGARQDEESISSRRS